MMAVIMVTVGVGGGVCVGIHGVSSPGGDNEGRGRVYWMRIRGIMGSVGVIGVMRW